MKRTFLILAALLLATVPSKAQIDLGEDRDAAPRAGQAAPRTPGAGRTERANPNQRTPDRINGEVTRVEGSVFSIKNQRGVVNTVTVLSTVPVVKPDRTAGKVADIKVGTHVNITMGTDSAGKSSVVQVALVNPVARGVVSLITEKMIAVKDQNNAVTSYTFTPRTQFNKDRNPAMWSDLKPGDQVVVEYTGKTATIIRAGQFANPMNPNAPGDRPRLRDRNNPNQNPAEGTGNPARAGRRRAPRAGQGAPQAQ